MDFSEFATRQSSEFTKILITNRPELYSEFRGKVIKYRRSDETHEVMRKLKKDRPYLSGIAGDYWFLTFERLLALELLCGLIPPTTPILHLENDMLSFVTKEMIDLWTSKFSKVGILRWSNYANAGALFAPNLESIMEFCGTLKKTATTKVLSESWTIDMQFLRMLLDESIVTEFPTVSEIDGLGKLKLTSDLIHESSRMICDSGDLGVFLFGRNSVYSNGIISQGFRYEHINWPIEDALWKLDYNLSNSETPLKMFMKLGEEVFHLPFIHVASKVNLAAANNLLLKELIPPNGWIKEVKFPKQGIPIESIHKLRLRQRLMQKARKLI